MALEIPIFFFPVKCSADEVLPGEPAIIEQMIVERMYSPNTTGLRQAVSRGWWHLGVIQHLCHTRNLAGLTFLEQPIAHLRPPDLRQAAATLDAIISLCATRFRGIPPSHPGIEMLLEPENDGAFEASSEQHNVNPEKDIGFEAAVGFYSFVKSLRAGVREALSRQQCLLYYSPKR